MSLLFRLAVPGLFVLLAACSATAPRYYSLQGPTTPAHEQERELVSDYVISVQPVLVPEQVARPQIVVADAESAEVIPLNAALWVGPLEFQIRDALSSSLTRRLNVLDIASSKMPDSPVWRIYVDIQRFDSLYGESVLQDMVWRLEPQGMAQGIGKRVCSAQVSVPVGQGMSALVEGHRRALDMLAGVMADSLPGRANAAATAARPEGVTFRGCVG